MKKLFLLLLFALASFTYAGVYGLQKGVTIINATQIIINASTSNHSMLSSLDFNSSGHTGFLGVGMCYYTNQTYNKTEIDANFSNYDTLATAQNVSGFKNFSSPQGTQFMGNSTFSGDINLGGITDAAPRCLNLNNYYNSTTGVRSRICSANPSGNGGGINLQYGQPSPSTFNLSILSGNTVVQRSDSVGNNYVYGTTGSEKVFNGNFVNDSGWMPGGVNWTWTAGNYSHNGSDSTTLSQDIGAIANRTYLVSFNATNRSTGFCNLFLGGALVFSWGANGAFSNKIVIAMNSSNLTFVPNTGFDGSISNVSVKEVFGDTLVAQRLLVGRTGAFPQATFHLVSGSSSTPSAYFEQTGAGVTGGVRLYTGSDGSGGTWLFGGKFVGYGATGSYTGVSSDHSSRWPQYYVAAEGTTAENTYQQWGYSLNGVNRGMTASMTLTSSGNLTLPGRMALGTTNFGNTRLWVANAPIASQYGTHYTSYNDMTCGNADSNLTCASIYARSSSIHNQSVLTGILGTTYFDSGAGNHLVGQMKGLDFSVQNAGTDRVTTATSILSTITNYGTIDTSYGIRIARAGTNQSTNAYDLYLDGLKGNVSSYGVYQVYSNKTNYLGDNLTMGQYANIMPAVDNAVSLGDNTTRFANVRAVNIISGDYAFEDKWDATDCSEFKEGDSIIFKVYRIANGIKYSWPIHLENAGKKLNVSCYLPLIAERDAKRTTIDVNEAKKAKDLPETDYSGLPDNPQNLTSPFKELKQNPADIVVPEIDKEDLS